MAELLFNSSTKKHHAESCGTYTYYCKKHFNSKMPKGDPVLKVMDEIGLDASKKPIKQINKSMVDKADIVIAIMAKSCAEKDLPGYVKNNKKFRLWDVADVSGVIKSDSQLYNHRINRDRILTLVKNLIRELNR